MQPRPPPPCNVSTRIDAVIAIGADILSPVKTYGREDGMSNFFYFFIFTAARECRSSTLCFSTAFNPASVLVATG